MCLQSSKLRRDETTRTAEQGMESTMGGEGDLEGKKREDGANEDIINLSRKT